MDARRRACLRVLVALAIVAAVPEAATAQPAVTVLHAFAGGTDGASPSAALIQAADGNFYGTTPTGGAAGLGTVFQMTPGSPWTVTVLHAFAGGTDGASPSSALIQAADGNFYGTTSTGGAAGLGTVFQMTPGSPWTVTVLHTFAGGTDGASPLSTLIQATDGNFYGTTSASGNCRFEGKCGTAFTMTPAGTVTILHVFSQDDAFPAALIQATDGKFYGTTNKFCLISVGCDGTAFTMTPAGAFTTLLRFGGDRSAYTLIQATDGNFYGTTSTGGTVNGSVCNLSPSSGCGTVFTMTPAGAITRLHEFSWTDGSSPVAALIQAADGNFYGTTSEGGINGVGVVFELTLPLAIAREPQSQTIASGATVTLSVGASGSQLSYQWYVGTTGTTTSPIKGATSRNYTTPALRSRTSYWVRVWNSSGTADSDTATVNVGIVRGDFEGNGKADLAVFRPSNGTWYVWDPSTSSMAGFQWGSPDDIPVPGDYDKDGKTDIAVFRPSSGTWYIVYSSTGTPAGVQWGSPDDIPVPGDYDKDGKTDIAVFRPSNGTWYVVYSSTGTRAGFQWGGNGDVPVPADYDGDGRTDLAVFRPSNGTWYVVYSSTGTKAGFQWGGNGDVPVPADYDGDGRTDLAVFRPSNGTWYVWYSSTGTKAAFQWGNGSDVP
jgi:uncharacterized repeat protein (TIGR03803 family)